MKTNAVRQLLQCGQSVWMDSLSRQMLKTGTLKRAIANDGVRGVTSNPDIFEKAITGSTLYDARIAALSRAGRNCVEIYEELAIEDIKNGADLLRPVFDTSQGADGFISLEVSPYLAFDAQGTLLEARRLWAAVNRPNLLVKVPATKPCIPVIRQLLTDGINVNITLLFSLERYAEVMEAYIAALEARATARKPLSVASVASFFLSRIDTLVDQLLGNRITPQGQETAAGSLFGKAATACARVAYQDFRTTFGSTRFKKLVAKGARVQRLLLASTGTKNPLYPDTKYIGPLVGPDTINTMPLLSLQAWLDHGEAVCNRIEEGVDDARKTLAALSKLGIDAETVASQIQEEGVTKFAQPFDKLLASVSAKRSAALGFANTQTEALGTLAKTVEGVVRAASEARYGPRLWNKDTTLWTTDAAVADSITKRLGWLTSPAAMLACSRELTEFAAEIKKARFKHAVLLGMGGSSLCPEVCATTFGSSRGYPELIVLDSTSPEAVLAVEKAIDLKRTLFIPASKSGSTIETNCFFSYFYRRLEDSGIADPGRQFVAITDPGSSLESLSKECGFRRTFVNPPDIGGRYSALSYFGLVPMAMIGMNVEKLLRRAVLFAADAPYLVSIEADPSVRLGCIIGELAKQGRDKLTFVLSPALSSLAFWIEQLLAESTGKNGIGILPVEGERLRSAAQYGQDRTFVSISLVHEQVAAAEKLDALQRAGAPVIRIVVKDIYDLGAEFLRWEIAAAISGAVLGINPFDEPNVSESKGNTARLLEQFRKSGKLAGPSRHAFSVEVSEAASVITGKRPADLTRLVESAGPGDYVAILAFVPPSARNSKLLNEIRNQVQKHTKAATTVGFGPRYLHSTGQLHKGGPDSGIFILLSSDSPKDVPIQGTGYSFNTLLNAQAAGDFIALGSHGRRAVQIYLGHDIEAGLKKVAQLLRK